jgi:2-polyprenyl-3-methyl-5-hydroxy-6-metoxy-1,4-benzoquinol methylase
VETKELIERMDAGVVRAISAKDEMFNYVRTRMPDVATTETYYFDTGRELAVHLLDLLAGQGLDAEKMDLLDFAAGYGRVTRWFSRLFQSVTMSDLEQDMVDFQTRQFGVKGFVSGPDPAQVAAHPGRYDLVFVFSLFTHLPESTWRRWLAALAGLVRPGGRLVFSTHSYELFAVLNPGQFGDPASWKDEFLFWETNETEGRLSTAQYGCNIVKESFVRRAVEALPGFELTHRFRMGEFDRYHDINVAANTAAGA